MIFLQPVQGSDAEALFPLIFNTLVADTLVWDGPESLESFRNALDERALQIARGERFIFTIIESVSGQPIGSASIRPDADKFRGDIGLWIGQPYQDKGYGTQVVHKLLAYGFDALGLEKIEGYVFVGNWASRGIFEKNGFQLEGTIRKAVRKRGLALNEWLFGITREDWREQINTRDHFPGATDYLFHICQPHDWQAALKSGAYAPESLEQGNLIHCSRLDQVLRAANNFYQAASPLALLLIDPLKVKAPIRWEAVTDEVFPHIYGPINIEAVAAVRNFSPDPDGVFRLLPEINPSSG